MYNRPPNCNLSEYTVTLSAYVGNACGPQCNGQQGSCNYKVPEGTTAMQTCAAINERESG